MPEPAAGPDPGPADLPGDERDAAGIWSVYGIASAVLALLAAAAVILTAVLWSGHRAEVADRDFQGRALQAAADWTGVLINLNADNVETSMQQLRDGTVGELNTGFDGAIAPYREVVRTLRARTVGEVDSVSVEALHNRPDDKPGPPPAPALPPELASRNCTVLVVATSVSENAGGKPTTVRWNLRLGVAEVDGRTMISRLESVR